MAEMKKSGKDPKEFNNEISQILVKLKSQKKSPVEKNVIELEAALNDIKEKLDSMKGSKKESE